MKKILIIGGAGFIGINTAAYFISRGWKVTLLDNLSRPGVSGNITWLEETLPSKFRFLKADIRYDQKLLDKEVASHDVVLHLAAQVAVTTSVIDPRMDFEVNMVGTLNVLEAARKAKPYPIFLYSSTNKVYGDLEELSIDENETRYFLKDLPNGITENQQLDFHSPYGCSKGAADTYVRDYSRIYEMPTVVFRQSCIYGPHQYGIEDQGWLAWFAISSLLEKQIFIYGTGKQVRDLLYVEDLARLYDVAIEKIERARGNVFNIGGGKDNTHSILEYVDVMEAKHDLPLVRKSEAMRPGDQKVFISDNTKAEKLLGWTPEMSSDEGVSSLVGWVRNNMGAIRTLYK